jgi:hypothetical protein
LPLSNFSVFGEILHPGNKKKKALVTCTKALSGKKWHILLPHSEEFFFEIIIIRQ